MRIESFCFLQQKISQMKNMALFNRKKVCIAIEHPLGCITSFEHEFKNIVLKNAINLNGSNK